MREGLESNIGVRMELVRQRARKMTWKHIKEHKNASGRVLSLLSVLTIRFLVTGSGSGSSELFRLVPPEERKNRGFYENQAQRVEDASSDIC